jgi:PadR family transcriptional regulator, regulatory protein PadR
MDIPHLSRKEFVILDLLIKDGEMFGLQLTRLAPARLPVGTVYVTLQRMSKKGFVTSRLVEDPAGGPSRRMYRVTARGYRMFTALQRETVPR